MKHTDKAILEELEDANTHWISKNQDQMWQTDMKCDQGIQVIELPKDANVQTEAIVEVAKPKLNIKKTELYQVFQKYYGQFDDFSEAVFRDFNKYNILSPHDVYTILRKIKVIMNRHK